MIHQEIARGLNSLQCTLLEVVVEDVLRLFPYALIDDVLGSTVMTDFTCCRSLERDNLCASVQDGSCSDASQEATGRVFLRLTFNVSHGFFAARCGSLILIHSIPVFELSIRSIYMMLDLT